jgi:hypothetical protein
LTYICPAALITEQVGPPFNGTRTLPFAALCMCLASRNGILQLSYYWDPHLSVDRRRNGAQKPRLKAALIYLGNTIL